MTLHVLQHNIGARRLYERLGFAASEAAFPYLRMDWRARSVS
jgi:ribosomal protein S18 acetylase RimI-like enzyme